ncbi:hypothetical protein [Pyruvatibacter mobilis]|jgi:hypothetical protein|uniref:hypothetical protein n=1 Tax=Pyruvatibacter mobilis TaxID=1712261 RepID=UPI000410AFB9
MLWIARITVALALLFSLLMGVQTFFMPEQAALALGFGTDLTDMGWNTFRGDIGAFFLAAAIFTALGLFAGRPSALYGAALLYGLALTGRVLGIIMAGAPEGIATPLVIEAVMVVILVFGARTLARA